MTTVLVAGSISISRLHEKVKERLEKIATSDLDVVVGDAEGADASIQECLNDYGARRVTVYCTGDRPRNNIGHWPVKHVRSAAKPGTRAYFGAKDLEMVRASDYGFMIWDSKSTGTLSNVIELMKENKKSVVFVNKIRACVNVSDFESVKRLLSFMSDHARLKAEEKIGLASRLLSLSQKQFELGIPGEPSKQAENGDTSGATGELRQESGVQLENIKLRIMLISTLESHFKAQGWTQAEAARRLGVTQPRISDLLRHKTDLFALDSLVNMAVAVGLHVEMRVA